MALLSITTTKTRFSSTSYRGKSLLLTTAILLFLATTTLAQNAGDYRSKTLTSPPDRNWNTPGNWERHNGSTWVTATSYPTSADGVITIKTGDSIAVNVDVTVDQLVIESGAKLMFGTGNPIVKLTIADGPGVDLINNGILRLTDTTLSDAWLILEGQMINNNTVVIETDCQLNVYGSLSNNWNINTRYWANADAYWTGKLRIFSGGFLDCSPTSKVDGAGDFTLNAGATIEIGSPLGIKKLEAPVTPTTNTGNIQTTHIRYFSPEAVYVYNGEGAQITGNGLVKAAGVKIANTVGVSGRTVTFSEQVTMDYLKIDPDAKANLGAFVHPTGSLILPPQSYATDKYGGTGSTVDGLSTGASIPSTNVLSTYFANNTGCVDLKNYATLVYSSTGKFIPCSSVTSAFDIKVEAWGGGGCGGTSSNNQASGGGGGGAYASSSNISINPGDSYTIYVGKGGSDGGGTTLSGDDSWFAPTNNLSSLKVLAKGGAGVATNSPNGALGGNSANCIGDTKYSGGNGANSSWTGDNKILNNYGGGGGSSAGSEGTGTSGTNHAGGRAFTDGGGGNGKQGNTGVGNPGSSPGGGGGGAYQNAGTPSSIKGGPGADGLVKLTYPPIFPTITIELNINACSGSPVDLPYTAIQGCADMYKIEFSDAAIAAGFVNIPYTPLPNTSPTVSEPGKIPLNVPAGVVYGTVYKAYLTVKNNQTGFPSGSYPLNISIVKNIWTGTTSTDWYTLSNWSCEIPKATSDITIPASAPHQPAIPEKPASATETARCRNIIIDSGASVTVESAGIFTVFGKMTNNNGVNGMIVKAGKTKANGSLIFEDPAQNSNIPATVEMFSKGHKGSLWTVNTPDGKKTYTGHYRWQYFGIPIKSMQASPTFDGSSVREYQESLNLNDYYLKWKNITTWDMLSPFKGYEITQAIDPGQYKLITFKGNLVTEDKTLTLSKTVDPTSTLNYGSGNHVFGNSYTAAIDITKIVFSTDVQKVVYIYSTGSLKDWQDALTPGELLTTPGEYISIPQDLAKSSLLPREITSMQGFALSTSSNGGTVYIPYNSTISSLKYNTYAQRVKPKSQQRNNKANRVSDNEDNSKFSCLVIDLLSKDSKDRTWLFSQPGTTHGYDNGWDGQKVSFGGVNIYSDEDGELYQVNTVDNVNGTYLSFRGVENISDYTLKIQNFNLLNKYDYVKLVDLVTNQEIPLVNDTTFYSFTANNTVLPEKRFL